MTIVAVRSPKGGVGRTSLTALLACALTRGGAAVTALDLDRQDALRLHCGAFEEAPLAQEGTALRLSAAAGGFSRVVRDAAAAPLLAGGPIAAQMASRLLAPWLGAPEILIVDMPAAEDASSAAVAELAGLHLHLFLPDLGSLATLSDPSADPAFSRSAFVLNQADWRRPLSESASAFLRHVVGVRFAGVIRRDEAVPEAFAALQPLPDYAPASGAWCDLTALASEIELRLPAAARWEAAQGPSGQTARRA